MGCRESSAAASCGPRRCGPGGAGGRRRGRGGVTGWEAVWKSPEKWTPRLRCFSSLYALVVSPLERERAPHLLLHSLAACLEAALTQLRVHTGASVGPAALVVDLRDLGDELDVLLGSIRGGDQSTERRRRPGISARVYEGSGRPDEAQTSRGTCQTMAMRPAGGASRTRAASSCPARVVTAPGQLARRSARAARSGSVGEVTTSDHGRTNASCEEGTCRGSSRDFDDRRVRPLHCTEARRGAALRGSTPHPARPPNRWRPTTARSTPTPTRRTPTSTASATSARPTPTGSTLAPTDASSRHEPDDGASPSTAARGGKPPANGAPPPAQWARCRADRKRWVDRASLASRWHHDPTWCRAG